MPKAIKHSVRFLNLVDDAKTRITEIDVDTVIRRRREGKKTLNIIDVREEREYLLSHIPNARHISKGIIERDIEKWYKKLDEELILYCGGGYRSALAAEALQAMGYTRVASMDGGWRGWTAAGGATTNPSE